MSLLRSIRNVANGYTSTQIKVRNVTANDENSATTHELQEIAELTYKNQELFFIMDMIDKRLNDKGKNWRHVYKSLVLLEYLVHNGSDNVIIWCNDRFYVIKTLREFQYRDEGGKDNGRAIRTRAKELVSLLNNPERLREVRRNARSRYSRQGSRQGSPAIGGGQRYGSRTFNDDYRSDSDEFLASRPDRPSRYRSNSRPEVGYRPEPSRSRPPEDENDEDIRRAIELSKRTVQEDEARRAQLRSASTADVSKAMNISQAEQTATMGFNTTGNALFSQDDWNNYQRAQQEFEQYQAQLQQQQQLEQQLAQQQQVLAQQQQDMMGYSSQPANYQMSSYTGQQFSQPTGQAQQYPQSSQATGAGLQSQNTGYQYQSQNTGLQSQNTGFQSQNTGYGNQPQQQATGGQPQPLQAVKTGSNNPFAMGQPQQQSQPQQSSYQQAQPSYQQAQFQQQYQHPQHTNNPFQQQQYTGIATTQMQPSHTGFGFGNAQNAPNHRPSDSLIDL